jgi:DNA helicase-2/ATP-dependent DNA helicase PcrA
LPSSNKVVVASAGSGKTEEIVVRALAIPSSEGVVITTYTDNGANEIRARIRQKAGLIPANVHVISWLTFLLKHGVKPYQADLVGINTVRGLHFEPRPYGPKKTEVKRYYLDGAAKAYRDFLAEFAVLINQQSSGATVQRLAQIYKHFFFDEIQDISGRDFEFIELLLKSSIAVTMVGDPRQGTFSTTQSRTNRGQTKSEIMKWVSKLETAHLVDVEVHNHSNRCGQAICDFADALYPEHSATESRNHISTVHDGVVFLRSSDVEAYSTLFDPQLLVWNVKSKTFGLSSRNMGDVKGLTFDRVLINPTVTMLKHLQKGDELAGETRAKFYVAITRARYSVAVIVDKPGQSSIAYWKPPLDQ